MPTPNRAWVGDVTAVWTLEGWLYLAVLLEGALLLDVRSAEEFASGSAPGSVNIPLQELGPRLGEVPRTAPVVVCCASGTRSGRATRLLKKSGYTQVFNIGPWRNLLG